MDDGVDYTHPDLMHNYVCSSIDPIKLHSEHFFCFRMQQLVMILAVMIAIRIHVILMTGLIGKARSEKKLLITLILSSHGTRCAGEIAAARDNNICGVGVAYDSMVAGKMSGDIPDDSKLFHPIGIRMLDQPYMTGNDRLKIREKTLHCSYLQISLKPIRCHMNLT